MDPRLAALQTRAKNAGVGVAKSLSKKFLYDPATKRPFPSSPLYIDKFDPTDPNQMMMVAGMTGPISGIGSAMKMRGAQKLVKPAVFDEALDVVKGTPAGMQGMSLDDVMRKHDIVDMAKQQQLLPHEIAGVKPDAALALVQRRLRAYEEMAKRALKRKH